MALHPQQRIPVVVFRRVVVLKVAGPALVVVLHVPDDRMAHQDQVEQVAVAVVLQARVVLAVVARRTPGLRAEPEHHLQCLGMGAYLRGAAAARGRVPPPTRLRGLRALHEHHEDPHEEVAYHPQHQGVAVAFDAGSDVVEVRTVAPDAGVAVAEDRAVPILDQVDRQDRLDHPDRRGRAAFVVDLGTA